MAVKGCPINFQDRCRHCPLPFDVRVEKCKWYRELRKRFTAIKPQGWRSGFFRLPP
jgi:hypothetical protein